MRAASRRSIALILATIIGMTALLSCATSARRLPWTAPWSADPAAAQTQGKPAAAHWYWHTQGVWVVNSGGQHVRIAGVMWNGMEGYRFVPDGLNFRRYDLILAEIKRLGFNVVRIPLSDELVFRDPVVRQGLRANPGLVGLHALQVLDRIVAAAGRIGLRVILDNHRSTAASRAEVGTLNQGLWYTPAISEQRWIDDWVTLARRYAGNSTVVGVDLRNEPHPYSHWPTNLQTYVQWGPTWGPVRGRDNPSVDWRRAAVRCGNAVLAVNPHLLIIIEGVTQWLDSGQPGRLETYWWGSVLRGVRTNPVKLRVPHQLVYSTHEWGPRKVRIATFTKHITYPALVQQFNSYWGFILNPKASYVAPVLLGEFGTCTRHPRCIADPRPKSQGLWFQTLLRYLKAHPYVGWSFYPLDGTNLLDIPAGNSVLDRTWTRPQSSLLMQALRPIERP